MGSHKVLQLYQNPDFSSREFLISTCLLNLVAVNSWFSLSQQYRSNRRQQCTLRANTRKQPFPRAGSMQGVREWNQAVTVAGWRRDCISPTYSGACQFVLVITNKCPFPPLSNSAQLHKEVLELHKVSDFSWQLFDDHRLLQMTVRAEAGFCRTVYLYRSVDSTSSKV